MTVLPFLDIKATPIRSVESSRTTSLPRITEPTTPVEPLTKTNRTSIPPQRSRTPKIKITARTDETLKNLPKKKPIGAQAFNYVWKPLIRELPDYDYLWEPVSREDIRHQYDNYVAPSRIIASRPDEPYTMTTMFETEDRHYHNSRRVRAMQQRQWNREHIQYTVYPYAAQAERELYNRNIRTTLKGQMEEKAQAEKSEQEMKLFETQLMIEKERQEEEKTKQRRIERAQFLFKVTARNKELMEHKWEYDQWNRTHQWHVDRTILADDPINWSKTLT